MRWPAARAHDRYEQPNADPQPSRFAPTTSISPARLRALSCAVSAHHRGVAVVPLRPHEPTATPQAFPQSPGLWARGAAATGDGERQPRERCPPMRPARAIQIVRHGARHIDLANRRVAGALARSGVGRRTEAEDGGDSAAAAARRAKLGDAESAGQIPAGAGANRRPPSRRSGGKAGVRARMPGTSGLATERDSTTAAVAGASFGFEGMRPHRAAHRARCMPPVSTARDFLELA